MARVCNHANVIDFVGVVLDPRPALVTRFMVMGSVEDMLVRPGPRRRRLPLLRIVRMAADAAAGMVHLHMSGIVHRDLSARNLLVDKGFHVVVADFGFSRARSAGGSSHQYTAATVGPVRWLAPEAFKKKYSYKSDVFSFGVTLWEMLTGTQPWEGLDHFDVMLRVFHGERLAIPHDLPVPLQELLAACWQHEPSARPDMVQVHERLCKVLDDIASSDPHAPTWRDLGAAHPDTSHAAESPHAPAPPENSETKKHYQPLTV
jgi:serine/threonine protein kinase